MLNNSEASMLLRQAYVQHIISKHLCYRIFQPFLFSLGKRYDKADTFFQQMSNQLREKSTRKEAVWRHYTLLASYTASNAKKNAVVAAADVIQEISAYVKPFADVQKMDIITSGITRIVKYAVETWRYARMEREIITATIRMDGLDDDFWETNDYTKMAPYSTDADLSFVRLLTVPGRRTPLFTTLPVFYREGILPSLHRPTKQLDNGLIFTKGVVLYSDCMPVMHRKYELGQAHLGRTWEELKAMDEAQARARAEKQEEVDRIARERAEAIAREEAAEWAREEAQRILRERDWENHSIPDSDGDSRRVSAQASTESMRLAAKAEAEAARRTAEEEAGAAEASRRAAEYEAQRETRRAVEEAEARYAAEQAAKIEAEAEKARRRAEEHAEEARFYAQEAAAEAARQQAEEDAYYAAEAARQKAEDDAHHATEAARQQAEEEAHRASKAAKQQAEDARQQAEDDARWAAEDAAQQAFEEATRIAAEEKAAAEAARQSAEQEIARLAAEEALRDEEDARIVTEEAAAEARELARLQAAEDAAIAEEARLAAEEEAKEEAARLAAEEASKAKREADAAAARQAMEADIAADMAREEMVREEAAAESARQAAAAVEASKIQSAALRAALQDLAAAEADSMLYDDISEIERQARLDLQRAMDEEEAMGPRADHGSDNGYDFDPDAAEAAIQAAISKKLAECAAGNRSKGTPSPKPALSKTPAAKTDGTPPHKVSFMTAHTDDDRDPETDNESSGDEKLTARSVVGGVQIREDDKGEFY
jgi:hypothetical protein